MKKKDLKNLIDIYNKELKGLGRQLAIWKDSSTEGIQALEKILSRNDVKNLKETDELPGWPTEIKLEDLSKDIRELTQKDSPIQQLQEAIDKFSLQTIGSATGIIFDKIETKLLEDQLKVVRGQVITLQADVKKDHIMLNNDDKKLTDLDSTTKQLKDALDASGGNFANMMFNTVTMVSQSQVTNPEQLGQRLGIKPKKKE